MSLIVSLLNHAYIYLNAPLECKHKAGVCIEGLKHAGVLLEEVRNQLGRIRQFLVLVNQRGTISGSSGSGQRYNLTAHLTAQDPGVAAEEEAAAGIS